MRQIHRFAAAVTLAVVSAGPVSVVGTAWAQQALHSDNRSYGLYLPTPVQPGGHDEVRAADGTTCRSAVAGNGPILDLGGIGAQGVNGGNANGIVYGRIVMPLGKKPKRLDCSSLYALEIERLKHELRLAKMGGGGATAPVSEDDFEKGWDSE